MVNKMGLYDLSTKADFLNLPLAAGAVVTVWFGTGTNDATNYYLLSAPAQFVFIEPDSGADVSLVEINGKILTSPLSLTVKGFNTKILTVSKLRFACTAAVTLKIYAEGK